MLSRCFLLLSLLAVTHGLRGKHDLEQKRSMKEIKMITGQLKGLLGKDVAESWEELEDAQEVVRKAKHMPQTHRRAVDMERDVESLAGLYEAAWSDDQQKQIADYAKRKGIRIPDATELATKDGRREAVHTVVTEVLDPQLESIAFKELLRLGGGLGDVHTAVLKICASARAKKQGSSSGAPEDIVVLRKSSDEILKTCHVTHDEYMAAVAEDASQFEEGTIKKILDHVNPPSFTRKTVQKKIQKELRGEQDKMAEYMWAFFVDKDMKEASPTSVTQACEKMKDTNPKERYQMRAKELFLFECTKCSEGVQMGRPFYAAFKQFEDNDGVCDQK